MELHKRQQQQKMKRFRPLHASLGKEEGGASVKNWVKHVTQQGQGFTAWFLTHTVW